MLCPLTRENKSSEPTTGDTKNDVLLHPRLSVHNSTNCSRAFLEMVQLLLQKYAHSEAMEQSI